MLPLLRLAGGWLVLALVGTRLAAQSDSRPAGDPRSDVPQAFFSAHPPRGEAPLSVTFQDRSIGPVSSWSWDFGDGTVSHLRNPTHVYTEGGVFPVSLTVGGPKGSDRVEKPMGVVVTSCTITNARGNRGVPLKLDEDFVPITGDDSLGFYCVYSGKASTPNGNGVANNVGIFILPLTSGEVLLFGAGYGDANSLVTPTGSAAHDVQRVDAIIRFCLGRVPENTPIRFVAPHGHIDHVNADFVRELHRRRYPIRDIWFHQADANSTRNLPGWKLEDRVLFKTLRNATSQCQEELLAFDSPLGRIWFYLRAGHTPGSIDCAIDVRGDPANRFLIRGSGGSFGTCPIPGVREAIDPHGNVLFTARPPELLDLSPAHASSLGGTTVVLAGNGFAEKLAGTPKVLFDGVAASEVQVLDDLTLSCVAPPGPPGSEAEVTVLNNNGVTTLAGRFRYRALPTLTTIAPGHGVATGGTRVTLQGTGFQALAPGQNRITFGGAPATQVQVIDDAQLACTVPPGVPGNVPVVLSNLNGSATLPVSFQFDAVIHVTSLLPATGSSLGGARVQVRGSAFAVGASVPTVTFDGLPATDVVRLNDSNLNCTVPPGTAGTLVDVRVSGENGSDTLANGFRYFVKPLVSSLSPPSATAAGGTTVTITGNYFTRNNAGPNDVRFDGIPATAVVALSDTQLRCQVPPGVAGARVAVSVSNANGSGELADGFRYHVLPVLVALEPAQGPRTGETLVTLHGAGFRETAAGATVVRFGALSASGVTVLDDGTLTCRTPASAADGPVEVRVENANGAGLLAAGFRFVTRPRLSALSPSEGPAGGGTQVTLHGSGFLADGAGTPRVRFAGMPAKGVQVLDDATLTCRTPLGVGGERVDVRLDNANGGDRLAQGFRYAPAPKLLAVSPKSGPADGGTRLTLSCADLGPGVPKVGIGNQPALDVVRVSDEQIQCTTPPGTGAVHVLLRSEGGVALLPFAFAYGGSELVVHGVQPDHGPSQGGDTVEIQGSGFRSGTAGTTTVRFAGELATHVVALDDTRLSCSVPPGVPGSLAELEVQNGNGLARLPLAYRYHLQPALDGLAPAHGSALGGLRVTLHGSGLGGASPSVRFGAAPASEVVVLDEATLTCRVPPGEAGTRVDVRYADANGEAVLSAAFRYHPEPRLNTIEPASGTPLGGTSVVLTGAGFVQDGAAPNRVWIGDQAATGIVVLGDTSLSALAPAGPPGAVVAVRLENANGSATLAEAYRFRAAPLVTSLAPAKGGAAGGTTVVINGNGFKNEVDGANAVTFDGVPAASVVTVSDVRLRAISPPGSAGSSAEVRVTNSNGSAVAPGGFAYNAAPTVASIEPPGASSLGGTEVVLHGSGFLANGAGANSVLFGAQSAAAVVVQDDSTLRCVTPPGTPGSLRVVSLSNANGSATAPEPFAYFPTPAIGALVPPSGYSGGGTRVEITGSGFASNGAGSCVVQFGALEASAVEVLDDGRLACTTPAGVQGPVTVRVANANGSASTVDGFYYDFAPTLVSMQPADGSALGGTEVRLEGGGFATPGSGPLAVRFDASLATNVRVLSGTALLCDTPPGAAGSTAVVTVSNPRGSSSLSGFRYHARPTLSSVDPAQGPPAGGTRVTLRGSGFSADGAGPLSVRFGGAPASAVVVVNDTTLQCTTPPGPARSTADVELSNANGAATFVQGFRWLVPDPLDVSGDGIADGLFSGIDGAYLFLGAATGLSDESSSTADLVFRANAPGSDFGTQVASGDLNGDGVADVVVSAALDDAGGTDSGAVFVFFGPLAASPSARLASSASATFRGASAGDRFGSAVCVRDVSGDGIEDLIVGAPLNDAAGSDAGAVYVYRGRAAFAGQTTAQASVRLVAGGSQHHFGAALSAGDLSGDGVADVAVGAPLEGGSGGNSGVAYVFRGGAGLVSASATQAQVRITGDSSGDLLGSAVGVGDFDGNGIEDLFLGAPSSRFGGSESGALFLFRGGAGLVSSSASSASAVLWGENQGDGLGLDLATGDADGDGRADLLAGAPHHGVPANDAGRAYLVRGGAFVGGAISQRALCVLVAENSAGDQFGTGLAISDLDGDGRGELLVGAPFSNGGGVDSGRVHVFLGAALQATRAAAADDATYTGSAPGLTLGRELSSSN